MALKVERVVNRTVHAEEALGGASRLEPPHFALSSSRAIRFRKTARDIDAREIKRGPGTLLDITLATLLFLLAAMLFVYLSYTVISRF